MEGFHLGQSLRVFSGDADCVRGRVGTRKEAGTTGRTRCRRDARNKWEEADADRMHAVIEDRIPVIEE
jgi:hypothetical protein